MNAMTVYVDDMRLPARVGRISGRWSHLTADTRDELHTFAAHLGLKRAWFQDPTLNGKSTITPNPGSPIVGTWHYDVTDSMRTKAIRRGAVPITTEAMADLMFHRPHQTTTKPQEHPHR